MDSFSPTYKPTMDVDFTQSNVMVGEQRLRLGLWQASRSWLGSRYLYSGGAAGAASVASLTERSSRTALDDTCWVFPVLAAIFRTRVRDCFFFFVRLFLYGGRLLLVVPRLPRHVFCFPCCWPQVSEKKEGSLATNTFRGLHGAFIVADIARQETFHGVAKFRQIIDEKVKEANAKRLLGGGSHSCSSLLQQRYPMLSACVVAWSEIKAFFRRSKMYKVG